MSPVRSPNCLNKCSNLEHGDLISSAIVRGNEDEAITFIKSLCCQSSTATDCTGRTALHVAASCGKIKIILWLLSQGADINQLDKESGYTALHRAILYGNVSTAVHLCERGANLNIQDEEGLTPLDLIVREQPIRNPTLRNSDSLQLYVWGTNANYNLGQGNLNYRDIPEYVELIHRGGDFIHSLSLNKFHTIFLSNNGRAFACGFGLGGRLGLGNETSVIIPQQIDGIKGCVKMAATGVDHSIFLTEANQVFSCGGNAYHQLGLYPPPENVLKPTLLLLSKVPKGVDIMGVGAAKYHSVIWSKTLMFTFGLNAGQLGHIKNPKEKTIINPRQVSSLKVKEGTYIQFVGVSDGAIVVYTSDGSIQALHQYQMRCIASKLKNIIKIGCIGGTLDHEAVGDGKLTEKGGLALRVAALDSYGYLYIWTEETHKLSQCLMVPRKRAFITDFCISHYGFGFITKDYEAFTGVLLAPEKHTKILKSHFKSSHVDSLFQNMKLKKLPALHRVMSITCDPKGDNFAALQYKPKLFMKSKPFTEPSTLHQDFGDLLCKTSELDPVCDVIVTVGSLSFAAHSFMLSQHSSYLAKVLSGDGIIGSNQKVLEVPSGKKLELKFDIDVNIFREILDYSYTGHCLLLKPGPCNFNLSRKPQLIPPQGGTKINEEGSDNQQDQSAPKGSKSAKGRRRSGKFDHNAKISSSDYENDPLLVLQSVAKDWQMQDLAKQLSNLRLSNGCIIQRSFKKPLKIQEVQKQLCRNSFSDLWDVAFLCQDGITINAHKCVLVARSVYFEAMLMSGWFETNHSDGINMQVPSKVFKVILNYLYEDEAAELHNTKDIDFLCDILAIAHQLLIVRLQQICECYLAKLVTFKNAFELISFSKCYDASGLRSSILEFICLNLPTFFEIGLLTTLDSYTLDDLSEFYKYVAFDMPLKKELKDSIEDTTAEENRPKTLDCDDGDPILPDIFFLPYSPCSTTMVTRSIAPLLPFPSHDELRQALDCDPSIMTETEDDWILHSPKPIASKQAYKTTPSSSRKRRPSRNSDGGRSRKSSTSSQVSHTSTSEADTTREFDDHEEPFSFDDLQERNVPMDPDDMWVVVGKSPRENKSRAKEIHSDPGAENKTDLSITCDSNKDATIIGSPPNKIAVVPSEFRSGELNISDSPKSPQQEVGFFPSLAEAATINALPSRKSGRMPKFQPKPKKPSSEGKSKELGSSAISWRSPREDSSTAGTASLADIMRKEAASFHSSQQSPPSPQGQKKGSLSPKVTRDEGFLHITPERKGWSLPMEKFSPNDPRSGILSMTGLHSPTDASSDLSLSSIIKEEIKHTQKMKLKKSKPLSLIQLEDRAMEELLAYYGGSFNPEERVIVSRVNEDDYKPQWK